jgi:hypothetical protein
MAGGVNGESYLPVCRWPGAHKGPVQWRQDLPIPEHVCTLHYSDSWNKGKLTPAAAGFVERVRRRQQQQMINAVTTTDEVG